MFDPVVGKIKDKNGNEYDVRFFENSHDFPNCYIISHGKMIGCENFHSSNEAVRITKEIWEEIGVKMKWKRRKKVGDKI